MKIIGISGGIGAGKSTVSREFEKFGVKVIDADKISHLVTQKTGSAYEEIVSFFGKDILLANGEINRRKLGEIVFADKNKLESLNKITHKHIFSEMKNQIENASEDVVVLDVPLLFSKEFPLNCDLTIAVIADIETRIKRVRKRDGLSETEILKRIENQLSNEEYKELADICIINDDLENTKKQVEKIYESVRENF